MPVDQLDMNYAIVAIGGVVVIVGFVWVVWGRLRFLGPVHTLEPREELTEDKDIILA